MHLYVGDVNSKSACVKWITSAMKKFGAIDGLINNAAIAGPGGRLHEIDFAELEDTIQTNLVSPIFLCQQILKIFLKQGRGLVINLSGGGATQGRPFFSPYAISKCALVRMTETLALEYPQLRFYSIAPGRLVTPMTKSILKINPAKIGAEYPEMKQRYEEGGDSPLKAAELALWLFENQPEHLNGRLISAIWDNYRDTPSYPSQVGWWTLRRIDDQCRKTLSESL